MLSDSDLDAIKGSVQRDLDTINRTFAVRNVLKSLLALVTAVPWVIGYLIGKSFRGLITGLWLVCYGIGRAGGKLLRWLRIAGLIVRKGYWDGLGVKTQQKKK
jgi:hypothetical protein